jgi:hypothetical protein
MSTAEQYFITNEHAGTVELQPLNEAPDSSHDPTDFPWFVFLFGVFDVQLLKDHSSRSVQ